MGWICAPCAPARRLLATSVETVAPPPLLLTGVVCAGRITAASNARMDLPIDSATSSSHASWTACRSKDPGSPSRRRAPLPLAAAATAKEEEEEKRDIRKLGGAAGKDGWTARVQRMFSLKMKLQMCSAEEGKMSDRHRTASAKLEKLHDKRASVLIVQCSSKSSSGEAVAGAWMK
ncbi:hypothetical protein ZWY2020_037876 [Hordeum vulgare]|nr:hypothetical protein ZWY2020_037876 [Hordeum vulgare]